MFLCRPSEVGESSLISLLRMFLNFESKLSPVSFANNTNLFSESKSFFLLFINLQNLANYQLIVLLIKQKFFYKNLTKTFILNFLNFQKNKHFSTRVCKQLFPIISVHHELVLGSLYSLATTQAPELAKSWLSLAGWCFKWGKKTIDSAKLVETFLISNFTKLILVYSLFF